MRGVQVALHFSSGLHNIVCRVNSRNAIHILNRQCLPPPFLSLAHFPLTHTLSFNSIYSSADQSVDRDDKHAHYTLGWDEFELLLTDVDLQSFVRSMETKTLEAKTKLFSDMKGLRAAGVVEGSSNGGKMVFHAFVETLVAAALHVFTVTGKQKGKGGKKKKKKKTTMDDDDDQEGRKGSRRSTTGSTGSASAGAIGMANVETTATREARADSKARVGSATGASTQVKRDNRPICFGGDLIW